MKLCQLACNEQLITNSMLTSPHPEHLEDPEAKKWEELVSLVIESVVFSGLDDTEE